MDILISIAYGLLFFSVMEIPMLIFAGHVFTISNLEEILVSISFISLLVHTMRTFFSSRNMVNVMLIISFFMAIANTVTFIFHHRMFMPYDILLVYKGREVASMFLPTLMSIEVIIFIVFLILIGFIIFKLSKDLFCEKNHFMINVFMAK